MRVMEALTQFVVGMGKCGDHLLSRKVSGVIVAALAFACGAGLVHVLRGEPRTTCVAAAPAQAVAPARAEVSVRDTFEDEAEDEDVEDAVFEGEYANYAYGYSVRVPDGMVGLGATPPAPQHGFGIDLDHPRATAWGERPDFPKSYLYVDGSCNSYDWTRLDESVKSHLRFLREKGRNVRLQRWKETLLGGRPALRVVARYEEDGVEMVSDEVVAFRWEEDGEASVVYTLSLSTPQFNYERDRPALEELMKSWCLQPID